MHTLEGRDQVARALWSGGWDGFEPPLPSVVAATLRRWPGMFLDVGANSGLYSLIAIAADDRATAMRGVWRASCGRLPPGPSGIIGRSAPAS